MGNLDKLRSFPKCHFSKNKLVIQQKTFFNAKEGTLLQDIVVDKQTKCFTNRHSVSNHCLIIYNGSLNMKILKLIILVYIITFLSSCQDREKDDPSRFVPRPEFNPRSRSFTEPIEVNIFCEMVESRIFYTIDGSQPSNKNILYTMPINIAQTTTIKAIAYRQGYRTSDTVSATYTHNKVENPIISLKEGIYYTEQEVSIYTPTMGADIYFTLNGAEPIEHPVLLYENPFILPGSFLDMIIVKAKAYRENWVPSETVTNRYEFRTSQIVFVQGGTFSISNHYTVSLSNFYISNFPISQEQWTFIMEGNPNGIDIYPSYFVDQIKNPVETVTWYEAIIYCNRRSIREGLNPVYSKEGSTNSDTWGTPPTYLSNNWDSIEMDMTKNGYRLPTEMEWLFAAKGGNLSLRFTYAGSFNIDEVAWYNENSSQSTQQVGLKKTNELGIYDMSGNVWEWCWDWESPDFPDGVVFNPTGPANGEYRIQKGGSWWHDEFRCEIVYRGRAQPNYKYYTSGFRIVKRD